jgi:chaperonin GroES
MVWEGYDNDEHSRRDWLRRTQAAMDLALQVQKSKSFPWADCANIAFPLVTIAAMQFHARAYPGLIQGTQVVKFRVPADDPTGEVCKRAYRVGRYMSYQVLEEDQSWEEQHDRAFLQIPIVGCAFIKTRYSSTLGHNVSELVPAVSLVMDYYAKSVESCGRKTHILTFYRNEVHERCKSGVWVDITKESWYATSIPFVPPGTPESDRRTGKSPSAPDHSTPITFLEQYCSFDFDQDGYAEPYIVTIEASTRTVVRIVARWEDSIDVERNGKDEVVRIRVTENFTKYGLIPSPDGSIYDLGFGILLGPLNESVNSLCNMIMDAGTMSIASGGFLSRGVKIRGGEYSFSPFQWNRVDATGDDLRKGIVELPVREPSAVLFNVLTFLVNYTQRISGSTDAVVGENPGQNTPASTQASMVEQGQKIYAALFKRLWRCMKDEFTKLYILNARHLPITKSFGLGGKITREDFLGDPSQICPVADPNVVSDQQRTQQALTLAERSRMVGGYDPEAIERNLLDTMKIDGVEALYPGLAKFPPGGDPKLALEQAKTQGALALLTEKTKFEALRFAIEMQEERRLNDANILKLEAQSVLLGAQADSEFTGKQVAMISAMIGAAKARNDAIQSHLDLILRGLELDHEAQLNGTRPGRVGRVEAPPSNEGNPLPPPEEASLPQGAMV